VKLLLGQDDVNPDKQDNKGKTPLWSVSSNRHEGVVRRLDKWDNVNRDKPNNSAKTPLWGAAWYRHERVGGECTTRTG